MFKREQFDPDDGALTTCGFGTCLDGQRPELPEVPPLRTSGSRGPDRIEAVSRCSSYRAAPLMGDSEFTAKQAAIWRTMRRLHEALAHRAARDLDDEYYALRVSDFAVLSNGYSGACCTMFLVPESSRSREAPRSRTGADNVRVWRDVQPPVRQTDARS